MSSMFGQGCGSLVFREMCKFELAVTRMHKLLYTKHPFCLNESEFELDFDCRSCRMVSCLTQRHICNVLSMSHDCFSPFTHMGSGSFAILFKLVLRDNRENFWLEDLNTRVVEESTQHVLAHE